MNENKKKRLGLISFMLNGFLFLLAGTTFITAGKIPAGTVHVVAALFNIGMVLQLKKGRSLWWLEVGVVDPSLEKFVCLYEART